MTVILARAAEEMVNRSCHGMAAVRESRRERKLAEDSVVVLDCDEWGTVELEPRWFNDSQWVFDCLFDGDLWLVWYDGSADIWEAAPHEYVHDVNQVDGVVLARGMDPLRLCSLDADMEATND